MEPLTPSREGRAAAGTTVHMVGTAWVPYYAILHIKFLS